MVKRIPIGKDNHKIIKEVVRQNNEILKMNNRLLQWLAAPPLLVVNSDFLKKDRRV